MSVSRYELDAKCEAIEATMDARIQRMESKLDSAVSKMELIVENIKSTHADIKAEMREIRADFKNTKWQILLLCLTLLGGVIGILAITNGWQQTSLSIMTSHLDKVSDTLSNTNQRLEKLADKR